MNKKILFFICLILGLSLLFCVAQNNKKTSKVVLQFASWGSESEINIIKPIINDYELQNPNVKIDFMHIPQNYFQKIHLLFASNTSPDVIFINNLYLPIYAKAGVLEDLTPYKNEFETDKFYPQAIDALSVNGHVYAIPRDISNLVIFYNKNLFAKYRIPYPNSDWTLKDFLNISKKLTHLPDIFGISFEENPYFFLPYLTSNGGWTKEDTANYFKQDVLNSEINRNSLEFYANLRKKYHVSPTKSETGSATMAQMFLQGRIAMHLSGRWLVPKYRQEAKFDWDVVEFPKGTKGSVVSADSSGWAISKLSTHKTEAIDFIKFLSSKQNMEKFTQSGLIIPARIEVANSKYFLDNKKPKHAKVFLNIIKNSVPTPVTTDYNEIMDDLKSKTEYLFNQ